MNRFAYLICAILLFTSACKQPIELEGIVLELEPPTYAQLGNFLINDTCKVIVFFSPECPLSENYTLNINNLKAKYANRSIKLIGVVSGTSYSKEEIKSFTQKYKLQFELFREPKGELAEVLDATITPECYVLNEYNDVVYHGAIDNWAIDLGKKRIKATEHYLDDAIQHVLNNKKLNTSFVEAVGCYIE
ncbi:MAG: redoxin domain-containing protein [Bacteroidia bacterium]|nr:redoxin domain-containing protein [Bacteroidia bacterium]